MIDRILNFQFSIFNFSISGKRLVKHPLFSGSAIMILGSNVTNLIAYIYHLVIGRMLGPSLYGELAVMISLITMFTVSFGFLSLVIVKFVSAAKESHLESLLAWFLKIGLIVGIAIGGLGFVLSPFLSQFLHLDRRIVYLLGPILVVLIVGMIFRSFLQGLMKFSEVVILSNTEILGRLILGCVFIYLGFSVFGAIFGLLLSSIFALILSRYLLRHFKTKGVKEKFTGGKSVLSYSVPMIFYSFASNSFFSTDVILVKHFFDPHGAGIYASLSNLGKIIFFAAAPISSVMFPLVSRRHSKGNSYRKIFFVSFALTFLIAVGVCAVYFLFPDLAVRILYGDKFLEASKFLFLFGLFMSIYTLSSLVVNYYLSLGNTKVVIFVIVAALIQVLGIFLFHNSISSVIYVSIATASFLLMSLFIYFKHETQKKERSGKTG